MMSPSIRGRGGRAFQVAIVIGWAASAASAQTPADGWSGQITCVLAVNAGTYHDEQTQTWSLSGAPVRRNDFRDYPATWTVAGTGRRTSVSLRAGGAGASDTWTRSGSDTNGSITIFVPVNTSTIRIAPGQGTWRKAVGGIRGAVAAVPFTTDAEEWRFPAIDIAGGATKTTLSGSRTEARTALVGWRQPAGLPVTETCTWNLTKGNQVVSPAADRAVARAAAPVSSRTINLTGFTAAGASASIAPRTVALNGFNAAGNIGYVPPRTMTLSGFTAAGTATTIAPRTISLTGFTAAGAIAAVPRTITLTGFAASGTSSAMAPRTIPLAGFNASGASAPVAPRTLTLGGWTSAGP